MLMGLVFPTGGSARILGEWRSQVKAQIGFLPEQPYFYDYLTAHELLEYYGRLSGVVERICRKRSRESPGAGWADRTSGGVQLRKFSKGMLQRVGNCASHPA